MNVFDQDTELPPEPVDEPADEPAHAGAEGDEPVIGRPDDDDDLEQDE